MAPPPRTSSSPPTATAPVPPRWRRRLVGALVPIALVASLGSAGCGDDTATPDPTPTTTAPVATDPPKTEAPTSTTSTTAAAPSGDEAEVRAVIDRYWDAWFIAAGNPPDPANAELNAVLTGEAAELIIGGIVRWRDERRYVRIPENSIYERSITSVTFDAMNVATVLECVVDDTELLSLETGEIVDSQLATLRLQTTLVKFSDGWRITTSHTDDRIDERAACDE